jgi:ACR3 family arsenite efflux pump ArsB
VTHSVPTPAPPSPHAAKQLNLFERYLSLWVALGMLAGVALGNFAPSFVGVLRVREFGTGSQINLPIAVYLADDHSHDDESRFHGDSGSGQEAQRRAAYMVFVWSYLTDGDLAYTLVQVSLNDFIMLFLFAPIVRFLVSGAASLSVPFRVLFLSVPAFIVIPLGDSTGRGRNLAGRVPSPSRKRLVRKRFAPKFSPVTILALLATLVLIFAFQAENLTGKSLHVLLIAVPILLQVYFNSALAYGLMRLFRVEYQVAAPGALIGASNFFELAVATSIALFGPGSGAALATVVGVLIEVPVMPSVCRVCNRTRHWFPVTAAQSPVQTH